jgi:hypothetical protein
LYPFRPSFRARFGYVALLVPFCGAGGVISAVIMSSTEEKAAHSSINHRVGHEYRVTVTAAARRAPQDVLLPG